jgi:hypothetical protein
MVWSLSPIMTELKILSKLRIGLSRQDFSPFLKLEKGKSFGDSPRVIARELAVQRDL